MYSRSFKEFLAEIDVCMGGRVAEELGMSHVCDSVFPLFTLSQRMVPKT